MNGRNTPMDYTRSSHVNGTVRNPHVEFSDRCNSNPVITHAKLADGSHYSLPSVIDRIGCLNPSNLEELQLSLSIMQLDPADRAVIKIADRRDAIQKKAFTNWVNHHLSRRNCWVQDLFVDLRTGHLLVRLVECLTDEILALEFIESRLHWVQNVQRVLTFLRYRGIRIVNIRPEDIVDGNPKLTLGLIWIIILHFQLNEVLQTREGFGTGFLLDTESNIDEMVKQSLLSWCREATVGYPGVNVRDFSDSWRDGRALLALLHRYRPNLVNFLQLVNRQNATENIETAFSLAERIWRIPRLFDAQVLSVS